MLCRSKFYNRPGQQTVPSTYLVDGNQFHVTEPVIGTQLTHIQQIIYEKFTRDYQLKKLINKILRRIKL